MGYFNEIKCPEERLGCSTIFGSIGDFVEWINDIGLIDMPLNGCKFTWRRMKSFSKLDRILVSLVWLQKFDALKLWGLNCSISDHVPLLLESQSINWGLRPFQSLDAWFSHRGLPNW